MTFQSIIRPRKSKKRQKKIQNKENQNIKQRRKLAKKGKPRHKPNQGTKSAFIRRNAQFKHPIFLYHKRINNFYFRTKGKKHEVATIFSVFQTLIGGKAIISPQPHKQTNEIRQITKADFRE